MAIANGRSWQSCRVVPGRVLYVAGEGRTGVIRRCRGWCSYYEALGENVFLGRSPVQLIDAANTGQLEEYLAADQWSLIVLDTLARNFGAGNDNDQRDMSAAIANADRIREKTGATVLIVHHSPLEGRDEGKIQPRGSSALSGAADAIFTCQFDKDSKVITVASTKQKDAPPPEPLFLSFEVVDLGETDNFDNPITTVVLCATEVRPVSKKALAKNQRRLIQEFRSRGKGQTELLIVIREVTAALDLSRQSRLRLEEWCRQQPWIRPTVGGGYIVDLE